MNAARLRTFWRSFEPFTHDEHHYLQLPLRRLLTAATRGQQEDALVDYVIGLEALLGTLNERTELTFRFRVRGAVVLAKKRGERAARMKEMGELYDLRSRIVHGVRVKPDELARAVPLADEALRRVWNWYFENFCGEQDNRAAIRRIDENLIGAR